MLDELPPKPDPPLAADGSYFEAQYIQSPDALDLFAVIGIPPSGHLLNVGCLEKHFTERVLPYLVHPPGVSPDTPLTRDPRVPTHLIAMTAKDQLFYSGPEDDDILRPLRRLQLKWRDRSKVTWCPLAPAGFHFARTPPNLYRGGWPSPPPSRWCCLLTRRYIHSPPPALVLRRVADPGDGLPPLGGPTFPNDPPSTHEDSDATADDPDRPPPVPAPSSRECGLALVQR